MSTKQNESKATKPLKITCLKTYQPVEFGPRRELISYFHSDSPTLKNLVIEFHPEQQLVYISANGSTRIIFPANIQYMEPA